MAFLAVVSVFQRTSKSGRFLWPFARRHFPQFSDDPGRLANTSDHMKPFRFDPLVKLVPVPAVPRLIDQNRGATRTSQVLFDIRGIVIDQHIRAIETLGLLSHIYNLVKGEPVILQPLT
jgi:hypothetical protein